MDDVFLVRLRGFEIFICRALRIVLFICDVVKGYFSFVFPAPCPQRCVAGIADNNFTKSVECVLDMLFVFFCASHRKFPLPSAKSCGWLMVAFCDDKGRQHFLLSPLDYPFAKPGGAVNGGL